MERDLGNETVHDFAAELKLFMFISGYARFDKNQRGYYLYAAYKIASFAFFVCVNVMAATGVVLTYGNTIDTMQGVNMFLLAFGITLAMLSRHLNDSVLRETLTTIREGIYKYGEPLMDEEYDEIKKAKVKEIRKVTDIFLKVIYVTGFISFFFVPMTQYWSLTEEEAAGVINPYLPQPFYIPFETRTVFGYIGGYLINVVFLVFLATKVVCIVTIFISCSGQLTAQFQILNLSLESIEKRAHSVYFDKRSEFEKNYNNLKHKVYIYDCFKKNIRHHQALIRFKNTFQHFTGQIFLIIFVLAAAVLAAHLTLMMEGPNANKAINAIGSLTSEMLYTLNYCWYGEQLIQESSKVYISLYSTPWYNYDSKFKKLLSVMLLLSRNPVQINAAGFNIPASMETFGSIISSMYQIMNVVRSTD